MLMKSTPEDVRDPRRQNVQDRKPENQKQNNNPLRQQLQQQQQHHSNQRQQQTLTNFINLCMS